MQSSTNLASLRIKNNLTFQNLATILNVSLSAYKYFEAGLVPMSLEEINILSKYFDVSFDYLLGISKNKKRDHFRKSIDYRYLQFCIRYLRRMSKLSQKKFSKEVNYSTVTISKFENDGTKVNLDYLVKIANKFKISTDYICGKSLNKEILQ